MPTSICLMAFSNASNAASAQTEPALTPIYFAAANDMAMPVTPSARMPNMLSRKVRRAREAALYKSRIARRPTPQVFKPTAESHARMLLTIRKTVSPGLLPPPLETPSAPLEQMTQFICAKLESGAAMMHGLIKCLPTIDIGLPLAEAARPQASEPEMDVATFIKMFERDFIIRVSPMIKDSSLDRVTIVIGEDHVDSEVQQLVDKVMKQLRPERGDLLLMEGTAEAGMRRIQRYGIEAKSLLSMEENSAAYKKMMEADRLKFEHLVDTVKFVYEHLPTKPKINKLKGENEYSAFINQYRHAVPLQYRDELNLRIQKSNHHIAGFDQVAIQTSPLREKAMLQFIDQHRTVKAKRFCIVGAQHAKNMALDLYKKESIVMIPRKVFAQVPELNLPALPKQEL